MTRISPATIAAFEQMAAAHLEQARRISEAISAEQLRTAATVAAGTTTDHHPSQSTTAAAYRHRLHARAIARRGDTAAKVWHLVAAAITADDDAETAGGIARADLLTSTPPMTRWPARGPRLVVSCTRPSRGLAARWASHAPPRGQDSHMPSVNAGGAATT
jgi:hypothetical protein